MAAGIGVIALPVLVLGIGGYRLAQKNKRVKMIQALNAAIEKLYAIQKRLQANAERYKEELDAIKILVDTLMIKKGKIA